MENFRRTTLILSIFAVFLYFAVTAHVVAKGNLEPPPKKTLEEGTVEEATTPIQNRILKKNWKSASAEELADAFVEAVLGYELTFDVLIKKEKGDIYKRKDTVFNPENAVHVRILQENGYHIREKGVYKYKGGVPVTVEIRQFIPKLKRGSQNGIPLPLDENDPDYQNWLSGAIAAFKNTKKSLQETTGVVLQETLTLNEYKKDMTENISVHIKGNSPKIVLKYNDEYWTDYHASENPPRRYKDKVSLPPRLRKVTRVSFRKEDQINHGYPLNIEAYVDYDFNAYAHVLCGTRYEALGGKEDLAQLGCLTKAFGLINLNFSGGSDYALFMLRILYDKRISQGMTEMELRTVLSEVIKGAKSR